MKKDARAALYARCSTHDKGQTPELQLVPLQEYCEKRGFTVTREYVANGISGTTDRRPQFDRLIALARKRQIDIILVWKVDRFGRSLKQLVTALDEPSGLGIRYRVYILPGQPRLYDATGKAYVSHYWRHGRV